MVIHMMYNSTTDKNLRVSAAQAIAQGISEDGGLFVPSEIPKYSEKDMKDLLKMDYRGRAKKILRDYLSGFTAEAQPARLRIWRSRFCPIF